MKLLSLLALVLIAVPAAAAPPEGRWALRAEGRTVTVVAVERAGTGWTARIERPVGATFEANAVGGLGAENGSRALAVERIEGDRIVFRPAEPRDGEPPLTFAVESIAPDRATLVMAAGGQSIGPFVLVRDPAAALATGWEPERLYRLDQPWPDNPEMAAMFAADQADRRGVPIDWSVVSRKDAERRARTRTLLDSGMLRSGNDFYHAAFVFQHGDEAPDYLLAHALATAAAELGRPGAAWIAAATLDRYLVKIGQAQVFGTQYFTPPGEAAHQNPYDRALIPDSLRRAVGVPVLADQEARRRMFEERARAQAAARAKSD